MNKKIGRNDPCPCGSGKKYKKCCLGKDREIQTLAITASKAPPSGKDDSIYNSMEDVFESIRKEGFVPVIESENDGIVDDIEEFCVSPWMTVALVCKHAYSEEARTYELREDGKYEWTESGFGLPCPHCIDNIPPFEMTEEEIANLYKKRIGPKDLSMFQDFMNEKTGRNDPCPCGSGKKYKNCCLKHKQSVEVAKNGHVCEFCHKAVDPGVYTNVHVVEGEFCSLECETAMLIGVDLFFMGGFAENLIPHLRDEHGLTKDQIKVGVDRIFSLGDEVLCGALIDWENYY